MEFLKSNWKEIVEFIGTFIIGFFSGYTCKIMNFKNSSKVKGNYNTVIQKGNENSGDIKQ